MNKRTEIEAFITDFSETLIKHIKAQHPGFSCFVKLDDSPRRKSHRGGLYAKGYGMSLAMYILPRSLDILTSPKHVWEYNSFKNDPVIGELYTKQPKLEYMLTIAHEMAHAWQQFQDKQGIAKDDGPHQFLFKKLYAELRARFVNPHCEPQYEMKKEYLDFISKIKKRELTPLVIKRVELKLAA